MMTRFLAIVSGKGGTGKTTTAINLGTALVGYGRDVIVVDANFVNPNVSLHLGNPVLPFTICNALRNEKSIRQVAYRHRSGLRIIPANVNDDFSDEDTKNFSNVLLELMGTAELVIVDTSSHLTDDVVKSFDMALVVTNLEMPSVAEALKTVKRMERNGVKVVGVVVNKVRGRNEISLDDVKSMIGKPVVCVVPYDEKVEESLVLKHPVTYLYPESKASKSFNELASRLVG
jgi:septum site-determining protein MinD